jgi:hypothetical protein
MLSRVILLFLFSATALAAEKLAYLEYIGDYWQVLVSDDNEKSGKQITFSAYDKNTISWLAKGDAVFVSGIQGEAEIVDIHTATPQSVQMPHHYINDAVMSPVSDKIIYSSNAPNEGRYALWLYDPAEGHTVKLNAEHKDRRYDPRWDAEGKYIYYVSAVSADLSTINRTDIQRGETDVVIQNGFNNFDVSLAGNIILYSSNIKGSYDIWMLDGDKHRRLTSADGSETNPAWSLARNGVYYVVNNKGVDNLWFKHVDSDSKPTQLTHSKTGARKPVMYYGDNP